MLNYAKLNTLYFIFNLHIWLKGVNCFRTAAKHRFWQSIVEDGVARQEENLEGL